MLVEHDEIYPQPKFGRNRLMGAEIWPHEYLISPIEISVKLAWFQTVMNQANLHLF